MAKLAQSSSIVSSSGGAASDTGLSKWQLFALLGLGVSVAAVGLGTVWYLRRKGKQSDEPSPSTSVSLDTGRESEGSKPSQAAPRVQQQPTTPRDDGPVSQALEIKGKGNELFKQKKYREAIATYEDALSVCPADSKDDIAAIHHNIAACLENLVPSVEGKDEKDEMWKDIAAHCTTALMLKPRYIKPMVRRFRANDALGKTRDALLDVVRVLVLDEGQAQQFQGIMPRLLKEIGRVSADANYQKLKKLKPLEPPTQLIRSYFATYHWQDDLSKDTLRTMWNIEQDEEREDCDEVFNGEPFVRAASLLRDCTYTGIIDLLTQAVETGSEVFRPHAHLLRGTLYCLWRRDNEALEDLQRVLDWEGLPIEVYADAHVKRAAIFAGMCQLEKCHEEFERAVAIKPDHPDIYIQRARVSLESEDVNVLMRAPDDLEVARKLAPSASHTLYCLGAVYHRGGLLSGSMHLLQGAKTHFEEAYNKFPDCVEGIILYSLYLQDAQEIDKCEQLLERAIKLEPDNASAHFSLSLLYLMVHQDIDRAVKSLETAIAIDSSCIQAYEALASLEMQRGNKERANELYRQAIDNSHSMMELQLAYIAHKNEVCEEFNINPFDLMTSLTNSTELPVIRDPHHNWSTIIILCVCINNYSV